MKRTALALTLIWVLVISAVAGTQFVHLGRANFIPPINPKITIENPQDTVYNVNTTSINFTAAANWNVVSYFYSWDGGEMKPINNMAIISQEPAYPAKNPPVDRTTLRGSVVLSNLTDGWHNVTFYQIHQHGPFWGPIEENGALAELEGGEILNSVTTTFKVDTVNTASKVDTSLPTALAVASIVTVAFAGVSLLVYFKKRKHKV